MSDGRRMSYELSKTMEKMKNSIAAFNKYIEKFPGEAIELIKDMQCCGNCKKFGIKKFGKCFLHNIRIAADKYCPDWNFDELPRMNRFLR